MNHPAAGGNATLRNDHRDGGDMNKLPDNVKVYDGVKRYMFNQTWKLLFLIALSTKTQDGYTMRAVAEGRDQGGAIGLNIPLIAGHGGNQIPDPNLQRQHNMRKSRLLDILLCYVAITAPIFMELSTFIGEGVMACNYFFQQMHIQSWQG